MNYVELNELIEDTHYSDNCKNTRFKLCIREGNGTPLQYSCLEIPWTEKPGRLQTMRLQKELDMTWWLNKWVHVLWLNNFTTRYIYPNLCTCALLDTYSRKFIEALFALAKNLKTIQISINSKWINKLWDTYPVKIFHCNENEWTAAGNTIVAQSQNCVWLFETPWTAAP